MDEINIGLEIAKQAPAVVAIVVVVVMFLRHLERYSKDWQTFLSNQTTVTTSAIARLTEVIESMEQRLIAHDVKTDQAIAKMEERTAPGRSRKAS
jgi:uncharacterized membrane protein YhiD involved in acid resistance